MSEQEAWNKITTYMTEKKTKKALEAKLQQKMVKGTIEKDVVKVISEEPKQIMVEGQNLDCIFDDECHTPIFDLRSYFHTLFDPEYSLTFQTKFRQRYFKTPHFWFVFGPAFYLFYFCLFYLFYF